MGWDVSLEFFAKRRGNSGKSQSGLPKIAAYLSFLCPRGLFSLDSIRWHADFQSVSFVAVGYFGRASVGARVFEFSEL